MENIAQAVKSYIDKAFSGLDPNSFGQEPAYIAALMGRLCGTAWEDGNGAHVIFKSTVVDDRGPNSAEKKYGADFALTLEFNSEGTTVSKAVLGQGKKGQVKNLSSSEQKRLVDQCEKMSLRTSEYIVMETPKSVNTPMVLISDKQEDIFNSSKRVTLSEYIVKYFIACKHGDFRSNFVMAVRDSNLKGLAIIVTGLNHDLTPNNEPQPPQKRRGPKMG